MLALMKNRKLEKLIANAKKLAGKPYKYGAKPEEAPDVFDCSGFIQYIYEKIEIKIPRSAIEQAEHGNVVKNTDQLQPGDLIFLRGERGHYNKKFPQGIGHIVMYLGNNEIIHATSKRIKEKPEIIEKGRVKIEPAEKILRRKDIIAIKRILG